MATMNISDQGIALIKSFDSRNMKKRGILHFGVLTFLFFTLCLSGYKLGKNAI